MQELQERYGEDYPPVRDYRKLKEGASETVRSIVIMVNAQLRLFEIPEIKRIFDTVIYCIKKNRRQSKRRAAAAPCTAVGR